MNSWRADSQLVIGRRAGMIIVSSFIEEEMAFFYWFQLRKDYNRHFIVHDDEDWGGHFAGESSCFEIPLVADRRSHFTTFFLISFDREADHSQAKK